MSFKEQAIADFSTFLNVEEFGDTVDFDGVPMACVHVDDEAPSTGEGITALESTLTTEASNFDTIPVVRQRVTIDGEQATVTRVDEEQGLVVLRLSWYEG